MHSKQGRSLPAFLSYKLIARLLLTRSPVLTWHKLTAFPGSQVEDSSGWVGAGLHICSCKVASSRAKR